MEICSKARKWTPTWFIKIDYMALRCGNTGNIFNFFNLSRNIVVLQVETHCCAYYVSDQLSAQQNTVLQVEVNTLILRPLQLE